jgi:hypothetical protein
MLKVPTAEDSPPPLMAPLRKAEPSETTAEEEAPRTKKRRRGKKHAEAPSWEHEAAGTAPVEKKQMRLMLIGGGALFALMVAGVLIFLNMGETPVMPPAPVSAATHASPTPEAAPKRSRQEQLAQIQTLAKTFLDAKSIEDLMPSVRLGEETEARMRKFYPPGPLIPVGLSKLEPRDDLDIPGKAVFASILTRELEEKSMAFVETPNGLRIDWEDWVGWSEISWPEFMTTKPLTPKEFRVTLTDVDYYNFAFSDDVKWQSFRLESPDLEHSIFGYAPKDSPLHDQLRLDPDTKKAQMILLLKFPEASTSSNQVIIDGLIGKGWVKGLETP